MVQIKIEESLKDVVKTVVGNLVNNPDKIKVEVLLSNNNCILSFETDDQDVGQVVGKNGHLMSALRSILCAIAGRNRIKLLIEYATDEKVKQARNSSPGNYVNSKR